MCLPRAADEGQANIHFTYYLAKVLGPRGVTALSVHPGSKRVLDPASARSPGAAIWTTNLTTPLGDDGREALRTRLQELGIANKTGAEGASTTVYAALDPVLAAEHNGAYLEDCHVAETLCDGAKIPDAPEKLWRLSETLVNETFAY